MARLNGGVCEVELALVREYPARVAIVFGLRTLRDATERGPFSLGNIRPANNKAKEAGGSVMRGIVGVTNERRLSTQIRGGSARDYCRALRGGRVEQSREEEGKKILRLSKMI
jgi:hypothetical protein